MEDAKGDKRERRKRTKHKMQRKLRILLSAVGVIFFLAGFGLGWLMREMTIREPIDPSTVKMPRWIDQQLLTINEYSRPGTKLRKINGIVVHYMGNPNTTAQQNRDYFEKLKNQSGPNTTSVSSNFIIGLDGEIIQCVPVDEKAYASNNRNSDTVSIECCHPDKSGEFTKETYDSLIKLTAWLCQELELDEKDVIRHYDVTQKKCPKYFVDHEDSWKKFRKDVKKALRGKIE